MKKLIVGIALLLILIALLVYLDIPIGGECVELREFTMAECK